MRKKFKVIGYPIGHSMSPFIHKELFALKNVDAEYDKLEIKPVNLKRDFEKELKELDGFNITIPHKVAIIDLLDKTDKIASEYGAVNTVARRDGKYYGYNTDAYGFLKGLEFSNIALQGRVLVYGFGGAARTIITECLKAGCDVSVGTLESLLKDAEKAVLEIEKKSGKKIKLVTNEEITERYDLLINATPVGMYPKVGVSPLTEKQVELFDAVYDIVYNPQQTELLRIAKEKGKVCGGGLSMLVCQAEMAHTIWYGAEFTHEETEIVIEKSAKEMEEVFK